ncbi:hypothetical protein AAVH_22475 [Aphelenchoides avenae]|nr:hypothetical protein AAVH_22475 [Aphelenchus avenae]
MFVKPVFRSHYELCNTDLKVGSEEADITGVLAANEHEFFERLRGWALFVKDNTIGIQQLHTVGARLCFRDARDQVAYRKRGREITVAEHYGTKGEPLEHCELPMLETRRVVNGHPHSTFVPLERVLFVTVPVPSIAERVDHVAPGPRPPVYGLQYLHLRN